MYDVYDDFNNADGENEESSDNPAWFRNHKKLDEEKLKNLHPHLRSKYLAVRRHMQHEHYSFLAGKFQ